MTEALTRFYSELKKRKKAGEWFFEFDVIGLRRAVYNLKRLHNAGKLETRVTGSIENLKREYKIKSQ